MNHPVKQRDMDRLAEFRQELVRKPRLRYLFFELTDACNLCCLHCGSCASPNNRTYLPRNKIRRVMEGVARRYNPASIMICLTGGEPLMHPDFLSIAADARKLGFSCGITTNGTLIDPEMARKMTEAGIRSVTFSLDGVRESHDYFRNAAGTYDKTLAGIHNLLEASQGKILTQVTTVIHKENIDQLEEIYDVVSRLDIRSWRVINMEPIGRALEHNELLLDADQHRYLLDYIRQKRFDRKTPIEVTYGCSHYLTGEYEREVRDTYFLCGSGIITASVLCSGDIYSCLDIERRPELVQGNIDTDDFVDVWENRFQAFRQDRSALCSDCRDCPSRKHCRGDAAHTWDYQNNRPLLCMKQLLEQ